jgi:hypothetical protein
MPRRNKNPLGLLRDLVSVYHVSPTSGDPERVGIHPHRARANPHVSRGEGQGRGFYAWTNLEAAREFGERTIKGGIDGLLGQARPKAKGYRIYKAKVPRSQILPDAEIAFPVIKKTLLENIERVQAAINAANSKIPHGGIRTSQHNSRPRKYRKAWPWRIAGVSKTKDDYDNETIGVNWHSVDDAGNKIVSKFSDSPFTALDATTGSAQLLGPILKAIKSHDPALMNELVERTIKSKNGAVRSRVGSRLELMEELL